MVNLRTYQTDACNQLIKGFSRARRQILTLPTGAGKTVIAASLIERLIRNKRKVAFIADRAALVNQAAERLLEHGIDSHIVMKSDLDNTHPVQVASAQTLESRGMPDVDLAFVDECHTRRKEIEKWLMSTNTRAIGLTATPFTPGLMDIWQSVVTCATTMSLVNTDVLLKPLVFSVKEPDMSMAKISGGEWTGKSTEQCMNGLHGEIIPEWQHRCYEMYGTIKPTIVFAPTVNYGDKLVREFGEAGYDFRRVGSNADNRDKNIQDFNNGDCEGLVSVDALAKGFDAPQASVLIIARPLRKSFATHVQMLGRIMRTAPNKELCLVLDHAGNYRRFMARTHSFWADGYTDDMDEEKKKKGGGDPVEKLCPNCFAYNYAGRKECAICGYVFPMKTYTNTDEPLEEIDTTIYDEYAVRETYKRWHKSTHRKRKLISFIQHWVLTKQFINPEDRARQYYYGIVGSWPSRYGTYPAWEPKDCPADLRYLLELDRHAYIKSQNNKWHLNES